MPTRIRTSLAPEQVAALEAEAAAHGGVVDAQAFRRVFADAGEPSEDELYEAWGRASGFEPDEPSSTPADEPGERVVVTSFAEEPWLDAEDPLLVEAREAQEQQAARLAAEQQVWAQVGDAYYADVAASLGWTT